MGEDELVILCYIMMVVQREDERVLSFGLAIITHNCGIVIGFCRIFDGNVLVLSL